MASATLPPADPASAEISAQITRYRDGIIVEALRKVDNHFLNSPVDDFSEEERGFERGLRAAQGELTGMLHDKNRWR
jgi:hypothetical protein